MKLCSLVVRLQRIFCFQLDIFHSISTHCWLKEKKVKIGRVINLVLRVKKYRLYNYYPRCVSFSPGFLFIV